MSTKKSRLSIIVVGAGLGGVAASFRLSQQGHSVILFEQRPSLPQAGGAITVRPGASQVLSLWGLDDELSSIGDDTPMLLFRDVTTNEITMGSIVVEASDYKDWSTTRHQLMDMFYRRAIESGVEVRFNTTIYDAHEDEDGVSVTTKDGVKLRADLLIAADGIRSRLRPKILSDIVEANGGKTDAIDPHITNVVSHSVTIPGEIMRQYPELKSFVELDALSVWTSPKGWVVGRYDRKLESWWGSFATRTDNTDDGDTPSPSASSSTSTSQRDKPPTQTERLWSEHGDLPALINAYSHASPELKLILSLAQSCDRWLIAEMPPLPRWISPKSHMILLGDSAHAMPPNAAQGFSQIIEDIGVLDLVLSPPSFTSSSSSSLSSASNPSSTASTRRPSSLSRKLQQWETIRKSRAERIQEYARFNSKLQLHSSQTKHLLPSPIVKPSSSSSPPLSSSGSTSIATPKPSTIPTLSPKNIKTIDTYDINKIVTSKTKSLRHTTPNSNARFHSSAFFKWVHGFDVIADAKLTLTSMDDIDDEVEDRENRKEEKEREGADVRGDFGDCSDDAVESKRVLKAKI